MHFKFPDLTPFRPINESSDFASPKKLHSSSRDNLSKPVKNFARLSDRKTKSQTGVRFSSRFFGKFFFAVFFRVLLSRLLTSLFGIVFIFVSFSIDKIKIEKVLRQNVRHLPPSIRGDFVTPMVAWFYP